MSEHTHDITLHLAEVGHLFNAPEFDPFAEHPQYLSGVDTVYETLKGASLREVTRLTIILPEDEIDEGLDDKLRAALARYCDLQIEANQREIVSLRWKALKGFQSGALFLAGCLIVSALADGLTMLPDLLRRFLSEGFLIAGWVSLWHPVETLLYEWWPNSRDAQMYAHIRAAKLEIRASE